MHAHPTPSTSAAATTSPPHAARPSTVQVPYTFPISDFLRSQKAAPPASGGGLSLPSLPKLPF